jgi:hypothetical protein
MCVMVYLASDRSLPEIDWNPDAPGFHASATIELRAEHVRKRFSKPFVYYLGAHEGCGCGFSYETDESLQDLYGKDPSYLAKVITGNEQCRENVRRLREYVSAAAEDGAVELYTVWAGDEGREPTERLSVTPSYFGGDSFGFNAMNERRFFTVSRETSHH